MPSKTNTKEMDHLESIPDSFKQNVTNITNETEKAKAFYERNMIMMPLYAETIFTARCRHRHGAIQNYHFAADNSEEANEKAKSFCERNMMKLIYVAPFLTDMNTEVVK